MAPELHLCSADLQFQEKYQKFWRRKTQFCSRERKFLTGALLRKLLSYFKVWNTRLKAQFSEPNTFFFLISILLLEIWHTTFCLIPCSRIHLRYTHFYVKKFHITFGKKKIFYIKLMDENLVRLVQLQCHSKTVSTPIILRRKLD